jgi:hypothetical protein
MFTWNGLGITDFADVLPQFLPTQQATLRSKTCRLHGLLLFNNGNGSPNVHVYDRQQGTPIPILPDKPLAPGQILSFVFEPGRPCPNGITWYADDANVVAFALLSPLAGP